MRSARRAGGFRAIAVVAGVGVALGACFNSGHHTNVADGGSRLQLVIEPGRTDVAGTHFLLDTVTGDLWRLERIDAAMARWVRVAEGPEDLRELTPEDLGLPAALAEQSEE